MMLRTWRAGLLVAATAVSGCAYDPAPAQSDMVQDCPKALGSELAVSSTSSPLPLPEQFGANMKGVVARRLIFSVALGPEARHWMLIAGRLNVHAFGGTISGWTGVSTESLRLDSTDAAPIAKTMKATRGESASVMVDPGLLVVDWAAKPGASRTVAVDVLVKPGGVEVHDLVLSLPALWSNDGHPQAPATISAALRPIHHPPGYGPVTGNARFTAVLRARGGKASVSCVATTEVTILNDDAVRQPYWLIGLGGRNQASSRTLKLFSTKTGPVPVIFDSLADAHAFLAWVEATHAASIGDYRLMIDDRTPFDGEDLTKLRIEQMGAPGTPSVTMANSADVVAPVPQSMPLPAELKPVSNDPGPKGGDHVRHP